MAGQRRTHDSDPVLTADMRCSRVATSPLAKMSDAQIFGFLAPLYRALYAYIRDSLQGQQEAASILRSERSVSESRLLLVG